MTALGARIKALRGERALQQRQLAEKAGLTPSMLSQIESGDQPPPDSFCRWSTMRFANWPLIAWPMKSPDRHFRQQPWCTRYMFVWSMSRRHSIGKAGDTSSLRPQKPCGES